MDEDRIDKQLNDRIRDVFDNYEDTTADEGWLLLREKFPVEKKDRAFAWLWYAAAAIVLLGVGLWFIMPADQPQQVAQVVDKPLNKHTNRDTVNTTITTAKVSASSGVASSAVLSAKKVVGNTLSNTPGVTPVVNSKSTSGSMIAGNTPKAKPVVTANSNTITSGTEIASSTAKEQNVIAGNTGIVSQDNYRPSSADSVARATEVIAQTKKPAKPVVTNSAEAMARLLAEKLPDLDIKNEKNKKAADKKVVLGVYAATFFNYAEGSDNRVNMGAGLSSDVRITRHLKLSTGVSIAQNSLKYNLNTGGASAVPNSFSGSIDIGLRDMYASSSSSYAVASTPSSYRASLIGVDIPLNLKFQFNPRANDTYVSAGVSSGTFLNETYTTDYNGSAAQTVTQAKFSDFYLAKTLNFSFGVGYPLGKSNRMVIEPFLKYPLGGLGQEQIKFGSGGVNLKLSFSGKNK